MIFSRISRQIPEKSDVCRFSIKFAKTISKIAEIFEICENYSILFNFIQFYSIVSLVGLRVREVAGRHERPADAHLPRLVVRQRGIPRFRQGGDAERRPYGDLSKDTIE